MSEQLLERAGGFSNPNAKLKGVRRWHLMELRNLGLRGEMTFHDNSTFDGLAMATRLRDNSVPVRAGVTAEEAEVYLQRWDASMTVEETAHYAALFTAEIVEIDREALIGHYPVD